MDDTTRHSFWGRVIDAILPRACIHCDHRLSLEEQVLCSSCLMQLPRTHYSKNPLNNPMAQRLWGRLPVERAAALMFYSAGNNFDDIVHRMKYSYRPEIGVYIGHLIAGEMAADGFFEDIDLLVPVPLTKEREKERGYNQSMQIALGVSEATGIAVTEALVKRVKYSGSQTKKNAWERQENVENAFALADDVHVEGKHILLIDDVLTTGATIVNCGKPLTALNDVKLCVLTIGFTEDV